MGSGKEQDGKDKDLETVEGGREVRFTYPIYYCFFRNSPCSGYALSVNNYRSFEAEKADADARLKQLEARKHASTRTGQERRFDNRPVTNPDDLILTVSDDEDDAGTYGRNG